jgi:hypothetical protein
MRNLHQRRKKVRHISVNGLHPLDSRRSKTSIGSMVQLILGRWFRHHQILLSCSCYRKDIDVTPVEQVWDLG